MARRVSHSLGAELEDAIELELDRMQQGEGVERIEQALQLGQPVRVKERVGASAEPLEGSFRGLLAATALRLGLPIVTRDQRIQSAGIMTKW